MIAWVFFLALLVVLLFLGWVHAELRDHFRSLQDHYQSLQAKYEELTSLSASRERKQRLRRRDSSQQEYHDALNRLQFQSLQEYRMSELWRETKQRYRSSDYPQRCLICGSRDFDLHHRTYTRLGKEELFDLVPLCRRHHDRLHKLLDPNPELCVEDTYDYLAILMEAEAAATETEVGSSQAPVPACPGEGTHHSGTLADIKQNRSQAGKRWSFEEDAVLLTNFDRGTSVEQLAERLHRGVRAVEVRLVKLGRLPPGGWDEPEAEQGPDRPRVTSAADPAAELCPKTEEGHGKTDGRLSH
jgi:hypothetical protein